MSLTELSLLDGRRPLPLWDVIRLTLTLTLNLSNLLGLQQSTSGSYIEQMNLIHTLLSHFLRCVLKLSSHLRLSIPSKLPSGIPIKVRTQFSHVTCPFIYSVLLNFDINYRVIQCDAKLLS
jgi:hypothetical protein